MRFGSVALAQFFDVSFSGETAFTMTHGTGFTVVSDQRKCNLPPVWVGRTCVITFVVDASAAACTPGTDEHNALLHHA